eukprot:8521950-Pyramimonas_sp.AAC.1
MAELSPLPELRSHNYSYSGIFPSYPLVLGPRFEETVPRVPPSFVPPSPSPSSPSLPLLLAHLSHVS